MLGTTRYLSVPCVSSLSTTRYISYRQLINTMAVVLPKVSESTVCALPGFPMVVPPKPMVVPPKPRFLVFIRR
ncbi:hypothetical protein BHE74_00041282 [Ensete ventricosum]|nr:hypothetical protein BHE74_00041282 [Ensete ventricosum]RZS17091.1 hypothetical protein BHM03_00049201 [Ensete ventricosum]